MAAHRHNLFKPCCFLRFATVNQLSDLFRSRLSKKFDDRTARFHTSVVEDLRMFEYDIEGTEAHDIMLHEQGVIPAEALSEILNALEEIKQEWQDGKLEIGRLLDAPGAHCRGHNKDSIGICLIGVRHFTGNQLYESLPGLLYVLRDLTGLGPENVFGHYQFSDKTCPNIDIDLIRATMRGRDG